MAKPEPRVGHESTISGFPVFTTHEKPRIVTADPWAFLLHTVDKNLAKAEANRAAAFVEQGRDFFLGAVTSNAASKPLFYYYAFLNVMKAALLVRRVQIPEIVRHGINDPRANQGHRLTFSAQSVHVLGRANDNREFFPEVLHALGWPNCCNKTWKVMDLLALIPSIHRTYTIVAKEEPEFMLISDLCLVSQGKQVWARLKASSHGDGIHAGRVMATRQKFNRVFHEVESSAESRWFETDPVEIDQAGRDAAISSLGNLIRPLGISTVLTSSGYRYYMSTRTQSSYMPRLAAAYAVFFYLGSITRYRPYDFDKIVRGKYRWIIEELLATEPNQLLYAACSWLSRSEVVRPYAVIG